MGTICPYCNIEVSEGSIEAEDGCCPECGSVITVSTMFIDPEDASSFEDEPDAFDAEDDFIDDDEFDAKEFLGDDDFDDEEFGGEEMDFGDFDKDSNDNDDDY